MASGGADYADSVEHLPAMPAARADLTPHQFGRETVLHDEDGKMMHILNETAATVWSLCDGKTGTDEIVRALSLEYPDVPELELRRDAEGILAEFSTKGLMMS